MYTELDTYDLVQREDLDGRYEYYTVEILKHGTEISDGDRTILIQGEDEGHLLCDIANAIDCREAREDIKTIIGNLVISEYFACLEPEND